MRKARSVGEVYHHFIGTIDTPEKFEAYRLTMATKVWEEMASNDSRECRSCHDADAWRLTLQSLRAQEFHESSMTRGKTCIDCHKGIAHVLPEGIEEDSSVDEARGGTRDEARDEAHDEVPGGVSAHSGDPGGRPPLPALAYTPVAGDTTR